ncbi:MAG: hypothetical protein GC145_02225 [Caulobacter sp.]|nr:hypothetical protein [Caulobacter sp.]
MKHLALAAALLLSSAVPALAEDPPEGGAWASCQVSQISAYRDRLMLKCAGPAAKDLDGEATTPRVFAVETRDPLTETLLTLAIEAKGRGLGLDILYVKSPAANPDGCDKETCRRAAGVTLK